MAPGDVGRRRDLSKRPDEPPLGSDKAAGAARPCREDFVGRQDFAVLAADVSAIRLGDAQLPVEGAGGWGSGVEALSSLASSPCTSLLLGVPATFPANLPPARSPPLPLPLKRLTPSARDSP
ncbi:MAG: hypothetical protein BJ554DRAFT_1890 [Olpidium bornovanus]|uniref:Uncharacterized protein n=1 Tax=Olpidium bornovanus TaxID=278681 RepID=A0A8H7ZRC5_9FUNG|nr:MAG: hypothetical protein BJ554DRAFT_1890 [Olpidium bornovanus]